MNPKTSFTLKSFITLTENDKMMQKREKAQELIGAQNGCFERQAVIGLCF